MQSNLLHDDRNPGIYLEEHLQSTHENTRIIISIFTYCKKDVHSYINTYINIYPYMHSHTLLPMNSAPISWSNGISNGKLKGEIITTGPKGHLKARQSYFKIAVSKGERCLVKAVRKSGCYDVWDIRERCAILRSFIQTSSVTYGLWTSALRGHQELQTTSLGTEPIQQMRITKRINNIHTYTCEIIMATTTAPTTATVTGSCIDY